MYYLRIPFMVKLFFFFVLVEQFLVIFNGQFGKFTDIWANFVSPKNDGRNIKEQEKHITYSFKVKLWNYLYL